MEHSVVSGRGRIKFFYHVKLIMTIVYYHYASRMWTKTNFSINYDYKNINNMNLRTTKRVNCNE